MVLFKILCTFGFVLFMFFGKSYAACNICSADNYVACINTTSFRMCPDSVTASDQIGHCPSPTVCTTAAGICQTEADPSIADCALTTTGCNECYELFSCISDKVYGMCSGGKVIATGKCGNGKVCNIEDYKSSKKMCSPACDQTPTCPNTEVTTVAPILPDYATTCIGKTKGYYALPPAVDPTCKEYVYCEEGPNGAMSAVFFTCPSGYFDDTTKKCGTKKPSTTCT